MWCPASRVALIRKQDITCVTKIGGEVGNEASLTETSLSSSAQTKLIQENPRFGSAFAARECHHVGHP